MKITIQALIADYNVIFFSSPQILSGRNNIYAFSKQTRKAEIRGTPLSQGVIEFQEGT